MTNRDLIEQATKDYQRATWALALHRREMELASRLDEPMSETERELIGLRDEMRRRVAALRAN